MNTWISSMLVLVAGLSFTGRAETLYLTDGSVLTGVVLDETLEDLVLSNLGYGELLILKSNVIYRDSYEDGVQTESFAVTSDYTAVVARLQRAVPKPLPGAGSVNQLVPGDVQSVMTCKGQVIPFDKHIIADNSLISIAASNLTNETEWVILTSLQTTDLTDLDSEQKRFSLKYQLNQKTHLKIMVKLPASTVVQSITPKPQLQSAGLIIWDRVLERQQIFRPAIIFQP